MKPLITRDDVAKAMADLAAAGKKPTLVAIHGALNNRGSMSTLIKLKNELDAQTEPLPDSTESARLYKQLWTLAVQEGRAQQDEVIRGLRENIGSLASENERLDGLAAAARAETEQLQDMKLRAETALNETRLRLEGELNEARKATVEATARTTEALGKLADVQASGAIEIARLHADLSAAVARCHGLELELARAQGVLSAQSKSPTPI